MAHPPGAPTEVGTPVGVSVVKVLPASQGYKVQGAPQEAQVIVARDGVVEEEPVRNLLMRKSLRPFPEGALENAEPAALAAVAGLAAAAVQATVEPEASLLGDLLAFARDLVGGLIY